MRIDKYLKVSRIIKRRSVATMFCNSGACSINDKVAKPSTEVKEGDIIALNFGEKVSSFKVLSVKEVVKKEEAQSLYEVLQ